MTDKPASGNSSPDLKALADRIGLLFEQHAKVLDWANRWIKGGLLIVGGVLVTLAEVYESSNWAPPALWVGVAFVFAGGVWNLAIERTSASTLEEARKALEVARNYERQAIDERHARKEKEAALEERLSLTHAHIGWLATLYAVSQTLRELAEAQISEGRGLQGDGIQRILDACTDEVVGLLDLIDDEHWTLAVYQHFQGPAGGELRCSAYACIDGDAGDASARVWGVGEGVTGQAYHVGKDFIVRDLADRANNTWHKIGPTKLQQFDVERYRSFAAVPVRVGNPESPWGVVVASSSHPGRFVPNDHGDGGQAIEPLRLMAGMVALVLAPQKPHDNLP